MNRWGAGTDENWLFRRLAPGDTNSAQNASYTREDNALLSPDDEVNGSVDFITRSVRNGVDTQIVLDAINAQTVELKGASDKDLTEVFNNGVDISAIVDEIDTRHGKGRYDTSPVIQTK